ncbi:hypothetical protein [Gilvimarinus polysaccharolyticus]|uniref:hypothetical protein n=1 Tax=Gilvimarinus polysaccharolyticus TaxID=863921 RepID=UPI0006738ACE|nr:hypothetical protein [Gilvimarinus polysaccharolyticus]
MPRKTPLRQLLILMIVALAIVTLSIMSTLHVLDVPLGDFAGRVGGAEEARYHHATMTDAQLNCEQKLQQSFKNRISVMHVDNFSSRLSVDGERYEIFLEADIYPDDTRQGPVRELFFSCFVHASNGKIERFQYAGDSEDMHDLDGDGTNSLGL